jgi:hypothetical protein
MPVRFDLPRVGGSTRPQLMAHEWQIDFAFRRLSADRWYVGSSINENAAPFGHSLYVNINSFTVTANYGITDRLSTSMTFPYSYGTHSRYYQDNIRHEVQASGIGDLSFVGTYWLWDPKHPSRGNLSIGLGTKSLSGDNAVSRNWYFKNGTIGRMPVDQSIQLGDGGWGVLFQTQMYRRVFKSWYAFGQGWYLMTPKDTTNVGSPYPGVPLSVPDIYSIRAGGASNIKGARGLFANLGIRIDGIPLSDLVGGSSGFRRPGYSLYLDPGVSYVHGRNTFTFNIPVMVHQDFMRSHIDMQLNRTGGGDLAKYLIIAQYSVRFQSLFPHPGGRSSH